MSKIYTYDEIKFEFINRGYELITDHKVKSNEKYEYICPIHEDKGSQFIDWPHFHLRNQGCKYCGIKNQKHGKEKELSEYNGKELAESKGFEYIDTVRHDLKVWIKFICPKHKQYGVQEMPINNMKRVAIGCQHCYGRGDNKEEVLQQLFSVNPDLELIEPYRNKTERIWMLCKKHNTKVHMSVYDGIKGKGCYECGLEKLSQNNKITIDEYKTRLQKKFPNLEVKENYNCITENAEFYCHTCDCHFIDNAEYILRRGCKICNTSAMESELGQILSNHNIKYIPQYSYKDCKDTRKLPFDFYLVDQNMLIEVDGEQHYKPVNFGGISDEKAQKNFEITQYHDKIKTEYCQQHKINLLRIPYWERKNMEKIIIDYIENIK